MKKITIYANGRRQDVARYRIWQYYDHIPDTKVYGHCKYSPCLLEKYGPIGRQNLLIKAAAWINMCFRVAGFLVLDLLRRPDYIVVQKELVKKWTPAIVNLLLVWNARLGSRVIWDFDDNILANHETSRRDFALLSKYSYRITVTHDFLKDMIDRKYQAKAILLPTTDGEMYGYYQAHAAEITAKREMTLRSEVIVAWVATFSNMPYLEMAVPYLDAAAGALRKEGKGMRLKVICNAELHAQTSSLIVENIKWSKEAQTRGLLEAHVGIMPLVDNEFTRGKGGFKLVQYMSVGLPCVASNVGFNKEFIDSSFGFLVTTSQEWIDAFVRLGTNIAYWSGCSKAAFKHWTANFSYNKNLKTITSLING